MEIDHRPLDKTLDSVDLGGGAAANTNTNAIKTTLKKPKIKKLAFLLFNVLLLMIGGAGSPLLIRTYFLHGGDRKWFSAFLQTAGFPFLLILIVFSYHNRRRDNPRARFFSLTRPLFFYCIVIGLITGIDDYLYSYGLSFLPVSTASLLISMQLGFTAVFAYFIVKQKLTAFTINSVVLLTFGAAVLGVNSNGDRPDDESKGKYYMGFVMTLGAAVIYGMVLPLVELMYRHARQEVTYALVMEMQFVIGLAATAFCAVGMVINKDFQAISSEGDHSGLGKRKYYLVVISCAVSGQLFLVGLVGTIKYSSALLGGVIIALCIPITEVLAVFFFHENFDGEKGVALALSLWGTSSYFFGEYKEYKKRIAPATKAGSLILPMSIISESAEINSI